MAFFGSTISVWLFVCSDDGSKNGSKNTSNSSSPLHLPQLHLSASNPDLSSAAQYNYEDTSDLFPEHVLKVYKLDQTCKYFLVHKVRQTQRKHVYFIRR